MPSEFLYNLTKNLTAHLRHYLCAVLPLLCDNVTVSAVICVSVYIVWLTFLFEKHSPQERKQAHHFGRNDMPVNRIRNCFR